MNEAKCYGKMSLTGVEEGVKFEGRVTLSMTEEN